MTKFANLPDDCYNRIFVRLPTSTLLSCRRVSRAWLRNQQHVCRQRKSLIVLHGNAPADLLTKSHFHGAFISHGIDQNGQPKDFQPFLMRNQVALRSFDPNVAHFLAKTFPRLDTLIVAQNLKHAHDPNNSVIRLMKLYRKQVATLKLYFNYLRNWNILKVVRQLNSMRALKHITLETYNVSDIELKVTDKDLDFLTRVEEFYHYCPLISDSSWFIALHQLEQTDSVSQLEHIGLGNNQWYEIALIFGPVEKWPLANRFTHVPCTMDRPARFERSIGHFGSLTTFTIVHSIPADRLTSLSNKLTILSNHCTSLVHVKIFISCISLFVEPFDPTAIKPLESVQALDLVFDKCYLPKVDLQGQVTALVHTFPNLVSIRIIAHKSSAKLTILRNVQCNNFFGQLAVSLGRESLRTGIEYRQANQVNINYN